MVKNNLYYWEISKNSPEPLVDPYYLVDNKPTPTQLEAIFDLRRILREVCLSICEDGRCLSEKIDSNYVNRLINLLNRDGPQYTEFTAFMNALDISLSTFRAWDSNEQREALKNIVSVYCEKRFLPLYKEMSDKETFIIQAIVDRGASRHKTESGKEKLKNITSQLGGVEATNYREFINTKNKITYLDVNHYEKAFENLKEELKLQKRFDKNPDLIIRVGSYILITEAKHIKESGGAQDKSLLELCNFINFEEELKQFTVHYVSFLDGIYANVFFQGKHNYSKRALEELKKHPKNFFVNTAGFKELLKDLINMKE